MNQLHHWEFWSIVADRSCIYLKLPDFIDSKKAEAPMTLKLSDLLVQIVVKLAGQNQVLTGGRAR